MVLEEEAETVGESENDFEGKILSGVCLKTTTGLKVAGQFFKKEKFSHSSVSMFRERPETPSESITSLGAITWVKGTGKSHNAAWLTEIENAVLRGDSSKLLHLVSRWMIPMPVILCPIQKGYGRWEELDVYTAFPSSLVECIAATNESLPQGQRIRCFAGQISVYYNNNQIPFSREIRTKAAAELKFWTALDDGPDHCPISFLMPPTTNPQR